MKKVIVLTVLALVLGAGMAFANPFMQNNQQVFIPILSVVDQNFTNISPTNDFVISQTNVALVAAAGNSAGSSGSYNVAFTGNVVTGQWANNVASASLNVNQVAINANTAVVGPVVNNF